MPNIGQLRDAGDAVRNKRAGVETRMRNPKRMAENTDGVRPMRGATLFLYNPP